ncbi:MAG TPA: hypothetical protein VJT16_06230 [Streptosporangiaceae bacterium]|nr:hypothetical protein [Streptosporangiaceae bacterium]
MTELAGGAAASSLDLTTVLAERLLPSVTVYNRVEGRPRTQAFDAALRAEIRDPLWMLARQWQVGELNGDDAGSPIMVQVHVQRSGLTGIGAREGPIEPFGEDLPLESRVERRPVVMQLGGTPLALDLRLAMGRRWLKMLVGPSANLSADYRSAFTTAYGFTQPDPADPAAAGTIAHATVWQSYAAVAGRAMDGGQLYLHLTGDPPGQPYDGVAGVSEGDKPALEVLGNAFVTWFERLVLPAPSPDEDSWDPQRLDYRFRATAPDGASTSRQYLAEGFRGGRLDWWALDIESEVPTQPSGAPAGTDPVSTITSSMLPTPIRFAGMPATRWWAFEDGKVNLANVDAASTDVATLLFLEFSLIFANDWFLVPLSMPVASVAQVLGVAVTDVFGDRIWVPPAGSGPDDAWQRWSMFKSSLVAPGPADTSLLVLPVAAKVQDSDVHEEVMFVRDEMANMVWGVERTIPSGAGGGMPGPLSAAETLAFFTRLAAGNPPPPVTEPRVADNRYQVMGSVPEQWIPFLPVHVDGDNRQIQLQRAALPRIVPNDLDPPVPVEPRTALLRVGKDQPDPTGYLVHEEEVSRAGTMLSQRFRRTRNVGGRAVTWVAVDRGPGRGGGSSGLAFDQLIPTPSSPDG